MRKMADRCRDVVMLPIVQHKRKCLQRLNKLIIAFCPFFGNTLSRRQDVVCIFKQMIVAALKAGFLGAGHRMTADKLIVQPQPLDFLMNARLDRADICENGLLSKNGPDLRQHADVCDDRRTQKNIVAAAKQLVGRRCADLIKHPCLPRLHGGFLCPCVGADCACRIQFLQISCKRPANQAQADKTVLHRITTPVR